MSLDTTHLAGTALEAGQLVPDVELTESETGKPWRPSHRRQRAAQVLCFVHDDCEACLRGLSALAQRREDLAWTDAEVRIVLERPADGPFPVLLDPDGNARSRVLGPDGRLPTLVLTDRFTAVIESYPAPDHDFPDADEVVTTLRLLACDCD